MTYLIEQLRDKIIEELNKKVDNWLIRNLKKMGCKCYDNTEIALFIIENNLHLIISTDNTVRKYELYKKLELVDTLTIDVNIELY